MLDRVGTDGKFHLLLSLQSPRARRVLSNKYRKTSPICRDKPKRDSSRKTRAKRKGSSLRRPTISQERDGKKKRRPAPLGMTVLGVAVLCRSQSCDPKERFADFYCLPVRRRIKSASAWR